MKLSSIDVSIIMPVYNAEKYISESIRSVQNQNFDNWEIICIDDGSTDNSVNIVKKISLTDNRVKLLFQNHAGSGPARNKGIINAQGRYVCFLDADDIYDNSYTLLKMICACDEHNTNICGANLKVFNKNIITDKDIFPEVKNKKIDRMVDFLEFQNDYYYQCFVFNRKFLLDNNIMFPNYLRYQDPIFFLKALKIEGKFWLNTGCLYCYRVGHQDKKRILDNIDIIIRGIKENIIIANKENYLKLVERCIERINKDYYNYLKENLTINIVRDILDIYNILKGKYYIKIIADIIELYSAHCMEKELLKETDKQYKIDILKKTIKILSN